MNRSVLVVLTNYSRPANMPRVIAAWRGQSIKPDWLVVVDNRPATKVWLDGIWVDEKYPARELDGVDDVWRTTRNLGCASHFAPALMLHEFRYVLFADDDCLPGRLALENVLEVAEGLEDRFATIGQIGRRIDPDAPAGRRYVQGNAARHPSLPAPVDLTCRVKLFQQYHALGALVLRFSLLNQFPDEAPALVGTHDDVQLDLGIQRDSGLPSYLIPRNADPERELIAVDLDDTKAKWRTTPGWFGQRNRMIDMALAVGWRPVRPEGR